MCKTEVNSIENQKKELKDLQSSVFSDQQTSEKNETSHFGLKFVNNVQSSNKGNQHHKTEKASNCAIVLSNGDENSIKNEHKGFCIQLKEIRQVLFGYIFALLTAISWSFSNVFMKKSVLLNPFDQQIILFSVAGLIVSIFIFSAKKELLGPKKTRKLLCCRGLLASLGYTCLIVSLKMISPANCSTVSNVGILLTAILSRFILKEKLSISHIIALVLTILGVTMISMQKRYPALVEIKIESNASIYSESIFNVELINLIGTLLALSSTSLFSGVNIILKLLSNNNIHWSISTIYSVYFGLPLAITCRLICIPFLDKNDYLKNGTDVFLINVLYAVAGSVFDTFGLIFLNIALKYEDPTKITIVRTSNVFFVFLFQYFMLHIKFEIFSIIGAISIGVGSLLVLIMNIIEKKASQSNDSDTRFKRILFYKF